MATDTLKRLAGPLALSNVAATVYTVPALTTTTVRAIHVSNETGSSASFTLSIGADGAGKRLFYQVPILNADAGFDWTGSVVLAAAEVVQAYASSGAALTLTMSGIETA